MMFTPTLKMVDVPLSYMVTNDLTPGVNNNNNHAHQQHQQQCQSGGGLGGGETVCVCCCTRVDGQHMKVFVFHERGGEAWVCLACHGRVVGGSTAFLGTACMERSTHVVCSCDKLGVSWMPCDDGEGVARLAGSLERSQLAPTCRRLWLCRDCSWCWWTWRCWRWQGGGIKPRLPTVYWTTPGCTYLPWTLALHVCPALLRQKQSA